MPTVKVNGAHLYYQQTGSGPDIVFLHGAGGNHLSWWQQVAYFAPRYRCTVYDARGWGRSTGDMAAGRWSLGTDLVALLEELGVKRCHVVAQSMGGRAAAGMIRLAPQRLRSLVLSGTTAGSTNDRVRALQDELRAKRGSRSLREYSLAPGFEGAQPALTCLYRQINALNPRRPHGLLGRPPHSYRGSMHGAISSTGAPVLFVVGELDMITSPELVRESAGLIPGARVHEIKGAGHSSYFEKAPEFNSTVERFLAATES